MKLNKINFPLIAILLFSAFIYLYKLSQIPVAPYIDESIVGYNAYSILQTAKDENGKSFPLLIRYFNAYTPALHLYLTLPLIKIFGLSIFSVRLLSAFSGLISVYVFYLILKVYFSKKYLLLFSTFIYSILPWTVFNSRLGYEVMFAALLFNSGLYFLLKNLDKNNISYWGLFFVSISTYASHTQKYLAPIFLAFYLLFFKKLNFKSLVFLFITQIPNLILATTPAFWVKGNVISNQSFIQNVSNFLTQYLTYLSPKTLFSLAPDIDLQHRIPLIGLFFWWLIFPLVFGLKTLFTHLSESKYKFLLIWLLVSIIPASFSGVFISVQRALPLLFPLALIISLGIFKIKKNLLFILSLYSLVLLFRSYFILFPHETAMAWNYGYSQLAGFVKNHPQEKFVIDNTRNNSNYSLMLFHLKYPPILYQQELGNYISKNYYSAPLAAKTYSFGNLQFHPVDWQSDFCQSDFIIGDELSVSLDQVRDYHLKLERTISTPINEIALKIFSTPKNDKSICR